MPTSGRRLPPRPRVGLGPPAWVTLGLSVAVAVAQPAPTGRAAARELIRAAHTYDATVRERALAEIQAEPDVVQMNRVVVSESKRASTLDQWLAARRRAAVEERPRLTTGGAIERTLDGTKAELGVLRYEDLLAEDSRFRPDGPAVARWDLFRWKR